MANKSNVIITGSKDSKVSSMMKAMQGWETALAEPSKKPSGQFGRVVKIQTGLVTITNELDVEFTVPFDDDSEANEAEIKIYNLSKNTIAQFKTDGEITITAGYGKDTGVIFAGVISTVKTRWSGQDKVTVITALDDEELKERDVESISFRANTKASAILKKLVSMLGLPIAVFKTKKDHVYTEAVTVSGGLMSNIKTYAEVCGASAYVNKRKVYVRPLGEGDDLSFTVSEETGLIGSPEEFEEQEGSSSEKGVTFKMLLEHRVTTASVIKLKSRDFNGQYRVREGQHVCTESEFYTEVTAIG